MKASEYWNKVKGFGLEDDCPLCGFSFAGCHGLCIAHTAMNGQMGPFHTDYNDDCLECESYEMDALRGEE